MLETLSTWQNVTHLLGKRMGAKTNFYCDKKGLITKTILNRLLSVANQAFLDQSSQRILIRKSKYKKRKRARRRVYGKHL